MPKREEGVGAQTERSGVNNLRLVLSRGSYETPHLPDSINTAESDCRKAADSS